MSEPDLSIIIPAHNAAGTIEACLASIARVPSPPLEVCVVDDLSTDDTADRVNRIAREHSQIRLISTPRNGGPAAARNFGARQARGRYLLFLDADTELLDDTIERFMRHMSDGYVVVSGIYHPRPLDRSWSARYKSRQVSFQFALAGIFSYEVFNAAIAGLTAEAFAKIGGFNEKLAWGDDIENEEIGRLLHARYGDRMILDPHMQVRHHMGGFRKITRTYFTRVACWVQFASAKRRAESGGPATASAGAATVAGPAMAVALILTAWRPEFAVAATALAIVWLSGYGRLFVEFLRRDPVFLPCALVLNLWFSAAIALGAAWGLLKVVSGRSTLRRDIRAAPADALPHAGEGDARTPPA